MDIPFDIIDIIMKFKGAYSLNEKERPYINDIKILGKICEHNLNDCYIRHLINYLNSIKLLRSVTKNNPNYDFLRKYLS